MCRLSSSFHAPRHASNLSVSLGSSTSIDIFSGAHFRGVSSLCFGLSLWTSLSTPFAHPQADFPISLMVDTSNTHFGAVLKHLHRSSWARVSFFSKKLSTTETLYSAFDREMLAVYTAIGHFRLMLEGREFFVFTRLSAMPWAGSHSSLVCSPAAAFGIHFRVHRKHATRPW